MNKYIVSFLLMLIWIGCTPSAQNTKRQITVTIEPLRYFTEQIAGDNFIINTMVPKGGNPETYEPTPQQMVKLAQSDLYIKVGNIGFEQTWMSKISQNAPHLIIIDSSEDIELAHHNGQHSDPHTWMSTKNAAKIAQNIYSALLDINEKDSAMYKQNLLKLLDKIEKTNQRIQQHLAHTSSSSFLIFHPTLTYFARDYHLLQIPIEQDGREPSAAQFQQTLALAKQKKVKILFVQKEFANKNIRTICKNMGITAIEINPLSYNWNEEMVKIASKIR